MARKRSKGSLLPFAAGLAVGYLLFKNKGATTTAPPGKGPSTLPKGTILQLPGNMAIRGFTLHSGGVLRPDNHNMYL
jgi:hypothetical protein